MRQNKSRYKKLTVKRSSAFYGIIICERFAFALALVVVHRPVGAFDRILYAAEHRIEARIADRHVRQVLVFHSPCRQLAQEFRKILFRRRVGDLRDDAEFVAADAVAVENTA